MNNELTARMTNTQRLATVRECFLRWMGDHPNGNSEHNSAQTSPSIESESILIRDEFYCGRRLRGSSHHAVWFIEEDALKIFKNDGELACVLRGSEIDEAAASPKIFALPTRDSDHSEQGVRRAA